MSTLFDLSNKLIIPDELFANSFDGNFMQTSMSLIESCMVSYTEKTKKMYTAVAEAENVKDENSSMVSYTKEMQEELNQLCCQLSTMSDRSSVVIANYCNVAKERIDEIDMSCINSYTDKYIKYNTQKLLDPDTPRMNPFSIFEKEFNFIGQLMQELPATSSYKDKLSIVSTIYKNFSKSLSNNVDEQIYKDMFGDSYNPNMNLSEMMSPIFKGEWEQDHKIGNEEFLDAKECIFNSTEYMKSLSEASIRLTSDLEKILQSLNGILVDSNSNKLKINTKEDGIRNTTYSVDSYGTNQYLWLVRAKIEQILKVYSRYIMALSIKSECIINYIKQSCDIIGSMLYNCDKSDTDDESEDHDDDIDSEEEDDVDHDDEPEDPADDNALDGGDDILTTEDETDNDQPTPDLNVQDDYELEEAVNEFYMSIHEYNLADINLSLLEHAASLLLEEDKPTETTTAPEPAEKKKEEPLSNAKNLVDKAKEVKSSLWKRVIQSIVGLWNKFKSNILENYQKKIDYLKENEKYINMPKFKSAKIEMPKIDDSKLDAITIPDLNYESMKSHLDSEEEFINSTSLKTFAPSGDKESLSQNIKNSVISPTEKWESTDVGELDPKRLYGFCSKFISMIDEIKKMTAIIEKGEKTADQLVKSVTKESFIITAEELYFMAEAEFSGGDPNKAEQSKADEGTGKTSNIESQLKVYFSTCGKVLAAKMTTCQQVFDHYNAYLIWHIKYKKDSGAEAKSEPATKPAEDTSGKFD